MPPQAQHDRKLKTTLIATVQPAISLSAGDIVSGLRFAASGLRASNRLIRRRGEMLRQGLAPLTIAPQVVLF